MALFGSYTKPGAYTQVIVEQAGQPLFGDGRIPVLIGEGTEYFTQSNVELFRGSSSNQDDQAVNENISNQVTGLTRQFQTTYFPVVDGTGKGVTTNDPSKIQVLSVDADGNQIPVTVISLDGATGSFQTQQIIPDGTTLEVTYYFKRGDTHVVNEDLSYQIPKFASLTVTPSMGNSLVITTSNPGDLGNLVTLTLVAGSAVPDAQAVSGVGTDAISINITGVSGTRTLNDLVTLISAGIPTLSAGELVAGTLTGSGATALVALVSGPFAGGAGPATNTIFKTKFAPITDGTNGGVTTTNPADVQVLVNGSPAAVTAVDGANGLITLANAVAFGSTLTATYYYNTWRNTADLLPNSGIQSVVEVGLGPNRADYAQGTDYVLGIDQDGNGTINWGPSVSEAIGASTAGELANFTPAEVTTSVVDEKVYLVKLSGSVNGKNAVFTLPDTPTDGASYATDDPTKIAVYVGTDPMAALTSGPVVVARLSAAAQQVTLYNPPATGNVYATYYRNVLATHQYTVKVISAGFGGFGTFIISDELGRVAPQVTPGTNNVAAGGFATTGVVYPNSYQDAQAASGAAVNETITLTFNNDGSNVTPGVQAAKALVFGAGTLTFTSVTPGVGGNAITIAIDTTTTGGSPITVTGNAITINANSTGSLVDIATIAAAFPQTTTFGQVTCVASGTTTVTPTTTAATPLTGGLDPVSTPYTHSYAVSSSAGAAGSAGTGYLDSTYIDAKTGFRVTIVNPADHASFGVQSIPSNYEFAPGDTLEFVVKVDAAGTNQALRHCGTPGVAPAEANNWLAIPGLHTVVVSNYQSTAGDTVIVSTFRGNGNEPNIGQFYYVAYTTAKTDADYGLKVWTDPVQAYKVYGDPNTVNRLSLGIQFLSRNGAQTFATIQVKKQTGLNTASDQDYIAAIQELAKALPGSEDRYVNDICPLSTSTTVHQFLSRFVTTQAAPRVEAEAMAFVGYDQFTTPNMARQNAIALNNERVIAVGNPVAGVLITNALTGVSVEYPVSGEFMAAALMGLHCNPANDPATTLTTQNVAGFSRLLKRYDNPTMDQMAADGLCMLVDNAGALKVRHFKSTRPENPIYSEPTSTTSVDYTRQMFRKDMAQFIGRKLVDSLVSDVRVVANSRLKSLVDQQILSGYKNLTVTPDAVDPTLVNISVAVKPMFSLLYIMVTFSVTTTL